MRRIAVVTFGRADWSSCLPVARAVHASPGLELQLIATGAHLAPHLGATIQDIEAGELPVAERVETLLASDTAVGAAMSIGLGTIGLAGAFGRLEPEIVLVVGDRYELLSAASAALALRIPLAHVSGGDTTEGAIDEQVRHALTKLSHLHFVAMEEHAERLRQLGEEDWRIHVTGDPALDTIASLEPIGRDELERSLGVPLAPPLAVVTFHPTTLGDDASSEIEAVLAGLDGFSGTLVFTYPNADPDSRVIIEGVERFAADRPRAHVFVSLGQRRYYSLLAHADLMVGNSSSGIWEAPTFRLPAVNVGDRQAGRVRGANVIDAPADPAAIASAVGRGVDPAFRASLDGMRNPYGDGSAAPRILAALEQAPPAAKLLRKRFASA